MIIANSATAIVTPLWISGMRQAGLHPWPIGIGVIVICAIANIIFAIALFRWQRWGFYGFIATSAVALDHQPFPWRRHRAVAFRTRWCRPSVLGAQYGWRAKGLATPQMTTTATPNRMQTMLPRHPAVAYLLLD
jgi:hypothetical protein